MGLWWIACLLAAMSATEVASAQQHSQTKIADGEYELYEQPVSDAGGPFREAVYNIHETWTLSRVDQGAYEVQGRFESLSGRGNSSPFLFELSPDMAVVSVKEYAKLRYVQGAGPLTCEVLPLQLHCSADLSEGKKAVDSRTTLEDPYAVLWPISPFSLGPITRQAKANPDKPLNIELVTIEQPNAENPVETTTVRGPLSYVGDEQLVAGQKWAAQKFSLKVGTNREYLIWTSQKGMLLALAVQHAHRNWREEGIRLAHFHSYADF
jgi:hypothetical protein